MVAVAKLRIKKHDNFIDFSFDLQEQKEHKKVP